MQVVSGDLRRQQQYMIPFNGVSPKRWRWDAIGAHGTGTGKVENRPQAFLNDFEANSGLLPHVHQVDQFQILVAGGGKLGGRAVTLMALRYADRLVPCQAITAGRHGVSLFFFRPKADPGGVHLHTAAYKDLPNPGKRRYIEIDGISTSTEPVLQNRSEVAFDDVLAGNDCSDGLGACMLRLGAHMSAIGPPPGSTGGQYYLMLNGSLVLGNSTMPVWSIVYLAPDEPPLDVRAGPLGLEAMVFGFPRGQ